MNTDDPVAAFRIEAHELLEQVEADLLDLLQDLGNLPLINSVFRGLHTLKGSGAMFGFEALAGFTHHCETAFDRIRKGQAAATGELVSVILSAKDHMRELLGGTTPELDRQGDTILAALAQAVSARGDANEPTTAPTKQPSAECTAASSGWHLRFSLPRGALANGINPLPLLDELRELGATAVRGLRDGIPLLNDLDPAECHIRWEVDLPAGVTRDQIDDVFIFVMDEMDLVVEPISNDALDQQADVVSPKNEASAPTETVTTQTEASAPVEIPVQQVRVAESVRVPAERLDELMNRVGELVIAQSRLAQLANQRGEINHVLLRAISEDIERLSSELRDTTMVLRMMQVGSLFGRFRRLVHDLARETGKSIQFLTEGETTEVDKTVIERLADPLVHLIRNSCDHGLEPVAARLEAGKTAAGTITVAARQAGGEVIISVIDDGRGISRKAVRAKAEAQGLIAPEAVLDDHELLQMIFHPGFSTAAQVTSLSGRGVGMDVVKKTVESLRGSIAIRSVEGSGSEINLHVPLTLAIVECMFVRIGSARYAIPLSAVEECIELPTSETLGSATNGGRSFLDVRGDLVPYLRMRELFRTDHPTELHQKIVVVSALGARVGLVVDQIIGNAQTVIKPLSRFHARANVFAGATILGDGTVALIVDVAQLLAASQRQARHVQIAGEAA